MNGDSYSGREPGRLNPPRDHYVRPTTGDKDMNGSMSNGRAQSSRDDRRRDRDGGDRPRRRSRSPGGRGGSGGGGGGRREELDTYSSDRNYREREREERYQRGDRRGGEREWDRDRGAPRRDTRRDNDDRRAPRRDRDLFDDRRRGGDDRRGGDRRGGGGDRRDGRDQDDMRQMSRQQKSATPEPKKPREPTPDLTDVVPILEKKRRLTQWDIKPPGYENVTAEQAKLSGMYPLPGAPRQQQDPSRLQALINQPAGSATNTALKPSNSRQSKRLFVYNIPADATDETIADFFNLQLNGLNVVRGIDPCIKASVNAGHTVAVLEFKNSEDATTALALDGVKMEADDVHMDGTNGGANGSATQGLSIKRPKDYIAPTVNDDKDSEADGLPSMVPDSQYKIVVTHLPTYLTEEQVRELVQAFGELKSFVLVADTSSGQSRGIAFCEYKDAEDATEIAVEGLNHMELGDSRLELQRACVGIKQAAGELSVSAMSMMAASTNEADLGRVLCLLNMVTPEELMDNDEYEEIKEDIAEECNKYGKLEEIKIPRPSGGSRQSNGVGKIFVKYDEPASAQKALRALAGRKFADRTVVVTFFGEEYFDVSAW